MLTLFLAEYPWRLYAGRLQLKLYGFFVFWIFSLLLRSWRYEVDPNPSLLYKVLVQACSCRNLYLLLAVLLFFSCGPPSLTEYLYSPELTIFAHLDYHSTKPQLFLLCFHKRYDILNRKGILVAAAPLQNIVLYLTRFHVSVEIESVEFVWIFMAVTEIRI